MYPRLHLTYYESARAKQIYDQGNLVNITNNYSERQCFWFCLCKRKLSAEVFLRMPLTQSLAIRFGFSWEVFKPAGCKVQSSRRQHCKRERRRVRGERGYPSSTLWRRSAGTLLSSSESASLWGLELQGRGAFWGAQVVHQGQAILPTEIHKLDVTNAWVEVNTWEWGGETCRG